MEMSPACKVHPACVLERKLEYWQITPARLAYLLGDYMNEIERVLSGEIAIDHTLAVVLAAELGTTPEFWERLQHEYLYG